MAFHTNQHPRWLIGLAVLIALVSAPGLRAQDDAPEPQLQASVTEIPGATIVLDNALQDDRDWVVKVVEDELQTARERPPVDHAAIDAKVRQIVDAAFDTAGLDKAGALYDKIIDGRTRSMIRSESPRYSLPKHITVYVLYPETAKEYLRGGGTLPFSRYDAAADKANIDVGFEFFQRGVPLPQALILAGLTGPADAPFDADWLRTSLRALYFDIKRQLLQVVVDAEQADPLAGGAEGIAVSSLIQCAIAVWKPILRETTRLYDDDHTGWFSTGVALALGEKVLRRIGEDDAADLHRRLILGEAAEVPDFELPVSEKTLLRYMDVRVPIELEGDEADEGSRKYREVAAKLEAERLIEHLTAERVPALFGALRDQPIDTTAKLEALIKEQFDYDIGARLDRYQPDVAPADLFSFFLTQYHQSLEQNNNELALRCLILAHRVQIGRSLPDNTEIYGPMIALLSSAEGGASAVADANNARWAVGHRQADPPSDIQRLTWAGQWAKHALAQRDPKLAFALLYHLDNQPLTPIDHPFFNQMQQMLRLVEAAKLVDKGDFKAAKELLIRVSEDFPRDTAPMLFENLVQPNIQLMIQRIEDRQPKAAVVSLLTP